MPALVDETTASAGTATSDAAPTMRAVTQDRYGGPDQLAVGSIPRPEVGTGEVLIEVHAAGLDRGVWHLMAGKPYLVRLLGFGLRRPKQRVPGMDVAGRVVAVGENVERFAPGDEVFGIAKGAFAEYALASAEKIVHRPPNIPIEQAAVAGISGSTALQALTDVGHLQPGQRVLVIGASGGVGSFAAQLAKAMGAEVTGVCSAAKMEMVRALGVDRVLNYEVDDFADGTSRYDLIIDTGGMNGLGRLRRALAPSGTLVIVGGEGGDSFTGGIGRQLRGMVMSPFLSQRLTTFVNKERASSLEQLLGYMERGEVVPAVGKRYPLERAADAIRELVAGQAAGKSVIVVRGETAA